jgi:hypothetical protein
MECYLSFGNLPKYFIHFLVLAMSIRRFDNERNIVYLVFDKDPKMLSFIQTHEPLIKSLNITMKHIENPIDKNMLTSEYFAVCSKWFFDFIKIYPWTMTEYSKILFMDSDMMVRADISELFDNDEFTHSNGPLSPFNAGLFLLEPNKCTFNSLKTRIYEGDYHSWKQADTHYAYEVTQGLLYYHFMNKAKLVNRGVYNFQVLDDLNLVNGDVSKVKIVHFTGIGKPEVNCEHLKNRRGVSQQFHDEWHDIEKDIYLT